MGERNKIDIYRAAELLEEAVQTQGPDFVYAPNGQSCHYVPLGTAGPEDPRSKTGCLIGVALKLAGVDTDQLRDLGSVPSFAGTHERLGFRLTVDAARYFYIAQAVQDRGGSWGMARIAAETFRLSLDWDEDIW